MSPGSTRMTAQGTKDAGPILGFCKRTLHFEIVLIMSEARLRCLLTAGFLLPYVGGQLHVV